MKLLFASGIFFFSIILSSCTSHRGPDVSGIDLKIELRRLDQDFFAIDTNDVKQSLQLLRKKYPEFLGLYIYNILGLDPDSLFSNNSQQIQLVKLFLKDYRPIQDSVEQVLGNFEKEQSSIISGLKHVKYYFPKYRLPQNVTTFVGPMNASFQTSFGTQGDVLTANSIGVGLQLHLGKDFSFYRSAPGQELYPDYIAANFIPETIPVNCMKTICDDLYPDQTAGRSLIEQMVEKGKRLYLLELLLPESPKHLLIGYTDKQLKDSYTNEAVIWDFFLNNNLLNTAEQNLIKNYIGESPKTQEFGEGSPGNLGSFTGWQIVKKYMEKFPETNLDNMMKMDARKLYEASKYKPRA